MEVFNARSDEQANRRAEDLCSALGACRAHIFVTTADWPVPLTMVRRLASRCPNVVGGQKSICRPWSDFCPPTGRAPIGFPLVGRFPGQGYRGFGAKIAAPKAGSLHRPQLGRHGHHRNLRDLRIKHLRTQISSPWTNGKIEAFWDILQAEVLDRERFTGFDHAETTLARFAEYYNYHRLSGVLGCLTPAERYNGTPFTDRGFQNIPALAHLESWLEQLLPAA